MPALPEISLICTRRVAELVRAGSDGQREKSGSIGFGAVEIIVDGPAIRRDTGAGDVERGDAGAGGRGRSAGDASGGSRRVNDPLDGDGVGGIEIGAVLGT